MAKVGADRGGPAFRVDFAFARVRVFRRLPHNVARFRSLARPPFGHPILVLPKLASSILTIAPARGEGMGRTRSIFARFSLALA